MQHPYPTSTPTPVIGRQGGLSTVWAQIEQLRPLPVSVLITGESGTGKELVARALHRQGPFVAINCAALPASLIEADLFGYRRGSFTGAGSDRPGLFEQASGGTLFLDEIGDLPLDLQPKLLRVLQEKTVRRLGEAHERPVETRLLCATHHDLKDAMSRQLFRIDLYFRLAEYELAVPPLRQRRQDIMPLARHFLALLSRDFGKPNIDGFSPQASAWLRRNDWAENNVRQLSLVIKRAIVRCCSDRIELEHLCQIATRPAPYRQRQRNAERQYLRLALEATHGNIAAAARILGMKRSTFFDRLIKYGLHPIDLPGPDSKD
jgi:DNA-binding NtrC family response regulator